MAENEQERVNREYSELLNGIRVVLPGALVLFAFLLTLPFTGRFGTITGAERIVYFASFLSVAGGTALFITPSIYHRIRFRSGDKRRMLFTANRTVLFGSVLLAIGMIGSVYLVSSVMFGSTLAGMVTAGVGVWFIVLWYGLPVYHHLRHGGGLVGTTDAQTEADGGAEDGADRSSHGNNGPAGPADASAAREKGRGAVPMHEDRSTA